MSEMDFTLVPGYVTMNNKYVGRNNITYLYLRNSIIAKCVHPYCKLLLEVPKFQVIWSSPRQNDKVGEICLDIEFLLLLFLVRLLS